MAWRSAELRVCRLAQLHGGDLAHDIVVIAPEKLGITLGERS